MLITTALYAFSGVDDFTHAYLALFYAAVPIVFWIVLGTSLIDRLAPSRIAPAVTVGLVLAVAWIAILIQPASGSMYAGSDVGVAYDSINQQLDENEPVAFSFSEPNDWAVAVGILEQARRDGRPACVRVGPGVLEVLFTVENVCPDGPSDRVELIVTSSAG